MHRHLIVTSPPLCSPTARTASVASTATGSGGGKRSSWDFWRHPGCWHTPRHTDVLSCAQSSQRKNSMQQSLHISLPEPKVFHIYRAIWKALCLGNIIPEENTAYWHFPKGTWNQTSSQCWGHAEECRKEVLIRSALGFDLSWLVLDYAAWHWYHFSVSDQPF